MAGTRKRALIVATYEYDDPGLTELRAPEHDAEALADVLGDPGIGGFDVQPVINQPWHAVSRAVARFFASGRPDDLLLVHFSCHGVKDDSGELYFAATDTSLDLLEASAVGSSFVNKAMDKSRAGRILLLLDCCYSGAFASGMTAKATSVVDIKDRLGGRGRAVITASSALQYAFEDHVLTDSSAEADNPSVFTSALVRGLRSGDADRDLDGWVSLDELYAYVHDEVTRVNPNQTPKKWAFDIEGDVYLARRGAAVTTPSELSPEIRESMASLVPWQRKAVVEPLRMLLTGDHPGKALAARLALEDMAAHDDSVSVRDAAGEALAQAPEPDDRADDRAEDRADDEADVDLDDQARTDLDEAVDDRTDDRTDEQVDDRTERSTATGSNGGGGRWSALWTEHRRRVVPVVSSAAVLALLVTLWAVQRDGTDSGGGERPSTLTLPKSVVLLTSDEGSAIRLVAVDVDTEEQEAIGESSYRLPTVSPQRDWIAYLTEAREPRLMRVDGSEDRALLSEDARQECPRTARPAWNPAGDTLAVTCAGEDGSTRGIWLVDLESGDLGRRVVPRKDVVGAPTWGGDGRIYFAAAADGAGQPTSLWSRDERADAKAVRLTAGELGWDSHPDWSDSGLLFLRSPVGGSTSEGDIWQLTPSGREEQLTTTGNIESPTLAPDGGAAVWLQPSGADSSRMALWTGAAGGNSRELSVPGGLGPPAWGSR